ncbi:MAG: redoxin domain-containing protein [Blastocatellia bacterium]
MTIAWWADLLIVRHRKRFVVALALVFLLAGGGSGGQDSSTPLRLPDLNDRQVEPLRAGSAKAVVFIFTRTDCPISNRYAPEVKRLHEKFAASGVAFWLVYADAGESVAAIRRHLKAYGFDFAVLRDLHHELVKLTGVRVTPEAAVFVSGRMVYRGRIDDRYVTFGRARPKPTTHDLEDALAAILAGKAVAQATTTAIGCFIPELQ